jgi:hypothetical protein
MSKQIDDGGAAFPHQDWDACIKSQRLDTGMTLRDYFAAAALQGILTTEYSHNAVPRRIAACSYELADEMIKARKGGDQP